MAITICRYLIGDTPAKYLEWWMAAMMAYPEMQKKAQQELDEMVGRGRLPSFEDYEKLPYIWAMVCLTYKLKTGINSSHCEFR